VGKAASTHAARPLAPAQLDAIPEQCGNGHTYQPGSFTVEWDTCSCTPGPMRGHHLFTCLICLERSQQALTNIPYCLYLDF
jgi:hypothetical protein